MSCGARRRLMMTDLLASPGLPLPLTGRTRVLAILGDPIAQAGSPAMLNSEFRRRQASCVLVPLQVKPEDLDLAFSFLRKVGISTVSC